ncbi:MAG TPA: hypothetical protein VGI12_06545 [Vicinamibacterales bacterium]|jgi:hypothetical protein
MPTNCPLQTFAAAALLALAAAAPAAAQQEPLAELPSWRVPGWSFTPGVTIGGQFDSNVAIAQAELPGGSPASDTLATLQPSGQLEFYDSRTSFSTGYDGTFRHYFELTDLDGTDQRAYLDLRRMLNRRVTFVAKENYMRVPTTDLLPLNGVPFQRTGSRYNDAAAGIEARLTRTLDFSAGYEGTWVDFVRKDTPLTGGTVNGMHASLANRFSGRSSIGVEGGVRVAHLSEGTVGFETVPVTLLFEDVGALYNYRPGPQTEIEAALGFSHLDDRTRGITRNGPYVRAGITHHAERATLGSSYERSYVPSLTFGGTNQSEELRGYVQMPLTRNRFYVQESAAWRRTNPFVAGELPLDSLWFDTLGGYAIGRSLRVEGYWIFTRQETRLAEHLTTGLITRHVIGAQIVISEPMRIR